MSLLIVLLSGCRLDDKLPNCPSYSEGTESCVCVDGYYGAITWNDQLENWEGECISGLEMAVQSGDPSYLQDEQEILDTTIFELEEGIERSAAFLAEIYQDDGVYYEPTEWSNHIRVVDIDNNFILVQGSEAGYPLASAGEQGDSRYAAFGMNVVVSLDEGQNTSFNAPFSRVLGWLLTGEVSESMGTDYQIGVSSVGWYQEQTISYLSSSFDSVEDCDASSERDACYQASDLLVIGAVGEDVEEISAELEEAMQNGTAVLFLHTETWAESALGRAVLQQLGMNYGDYGGNFWSVDQAYWASVEDMTSEGGASRSISTMLQHFSDADYSFDWSGCTDS